VLALVGALSATTARAQEPSTQNPESRSLFGSTIKATLLDPTTYAPAGVLYGSMLLDWKSSQPFFEQGFVEQNARYTMSGFPNDVPVSYETGKRLIARDALAAVPPMILNNSLSHMMERVLIEHHPEHAKLLRVLAVIQRVSLSAYISYRLSAGHFRQWQTNERLARQWGYR
jgi:hypothetical protein